MAILERGYRVACILLEPIEQICMDHGVGPTTLTLGSLGASAIAAAYASMGWFRSAGSLYLTSGALDLLDGRVARRARETSPRGAALDSIADRVSETLMLSAIAWRARRRSTSTGALGFWAMSMMVSYSRARGEGLGVVVNSGLMVRGPRLVGLSALLLLEGSRLKRVRRIVTKTDSESKLFTAGLLVLAAATALTAIQRTSLLLRRLKGPSPRHPARAPMGSPAASVDDDRVPDKRASRVREPAA